MDFIKIRGKKFILQECNSGWFHVNKPIDGLVPYQDHSCKYQHGTTGTVQYKGYEEKYVYKCLEFGGRYYSFKLK